MRGPMRSQVWAALVCGAFGLAVGGCAGSEAATRTPGPSTTGGEATAVPVTARGNEASAQLAVADRPPPPYVDPKTVSSEPSALVQKPAPTPAPASQPPTYFATPPPAPRAESYPTESSAQWVWAPGYWYWHSGQYVWVGGAWIPARRGHVYVGARWVHTSHGWRFVPGGWALSTYDPIVYPVYPYDPFYYRDYHSYFYHPHHRYHGHGRHHGYGHHHHHSSDRLFVRPEGSRRIDRPRSSTRLRVRAR